MHPCDMLRSLNIELEQARKVLHGLAVDVAEATVIRLRPSDEVTAERHREYLEAWWEVRWLEDLQSRDLGELEITRELAAFPTEDHQRDRDTWVGWMLAREEAPPPSPSVIHALVVNQADKLLESFNEEDSRLKALLNVLQPEQVVMILQLRDLVSAARAVHPEKSKTEDEALLRIVMSASAVIGARDEGKDGASPVLADRIERLRDALRTYPLAGSR